MNYKPMDRKCIVCGDDIRRDFGRCTNSCCTKCHASFCTPGGITSPGHGINVKQARAALAKATPATGADEGR